MKIDHFLLFLPVLGPFPQVFGQVNEWLVLELQEMIKVIRHFVVPIGFKFALIIEVSREEYSNL